MNENLGTLERIKDIRTIWPNEARDFTPWLAEDDNLALLAETLGLGPDGFELQGVEMSVGPFQADILCRDTGSAEGELVLIENQYGRTDHDHLGKLITYSAGLEARSVILICERLRPEHRAALDWLNDITADDHRFFGVTIELWRIGNSPVAPKFNVIVAPNDWRRQVKTTSSGPTSDLSALYQRYWQALNDRIEETDAQLSQRKVFPQSWTKFAIGRTKFKLFAGVLREKNKIRASLYMSGPNAKDRFSELSEQKAEIESEIGEELHWDSLPNRKGARVSLSLQNADVADESDWQRQHDWLIDYLVKFDNAFRQRIKTLGRATP